MRLGQAHTGAEDSWLLPLPAARYDNSWGLVPSPFLIFSLDFPNSNLVPAPPTSSTLPSTTSKNRA